MRMKYIEFINTRGFFVSEVNYNDISYEMKH